MISDGLTINVIVMSTKPGVTLYDVKNYNEDAVSVSGTALSMCIILYDYLFLEMLQMGLGVDMLVSIFLLIVNFSVERILYCCACMCLLTVV